MTTRFSAEFAIRPFIGAFPDETREVLTDWTDDRHYHVWRLCSEGTRPRLPWATKLATGTDYALPLLERLHADPTRYVTRSVANHVNDISKIDPDLAIHTLERWRAMGRQSAAEMDYIVRHAARTLLRSGDARALGLLGISARPRGSISDG